MSSNKNLVVDMMLEADTDLEDPRGGDDEDEADDDTVAQHGDGRKSSLPVVILPLHGEEEKREEKIYTLVNDGVEYVASIDIDGFEIIESEQFTSQSSTSSAKDIQKIGQ